MPFLTIDPPGSMDLDQAVHLDRDGDGYRVRYAIADVPAFVGPGERSTPRRAVAARPSTAPDAATPCTRRCSARTRRACWPAQTRPAFVWDMRPGRRR